MYIKPNNSTLFRIINVLATVLLTILGLIFLTFIIGRVMPIDPVIAAVGDRVSHEVYETTRRELGLHLPLYKQFFYYLTNIFQGDFGKSFLTNNHVLQDIIRVLPATIELATIAMIISLLLGIPFGILAAIYKDRWVDHTIRFISLFGNSISIFWLALMGLIIFYIKLNLTAGPGRLDPFLEDYESVSGFIILESLFTKNWDVFFNSLNHILLPSCLLAYYKLAIISRMTRTFMLEQLNQEYILTAKVKGLSNWRVTWHHAFRNALVPLVTIIGLNYAALLEGSVFIETIFIWPGLGYYLTQALHNADMNAILGGTIIIGVVFILINLGSDFICKKLDPRFKL